ncbi:MAG: DUF2975 domain-containing protein [Cyclobacteriaceae bacterium]|nr:DUF2975 domain-containing protein [Cyclobacteriaceae bacterium]
MKTKTILVVMNVATYLALVGVAIQGGSKLISYVVSLNNPEAAKNLYNGLDLFALQDYSFWHYTAIVSFLVFLDALKVYTCQLVIKVLTDIKLTNPFTPEMTGLLDKISYVIFSTWLVSFLYNGHRDWLVRRIPGLAMEAISIDFIFMAGVVFIIAQVFKRGVEIQSENDLTV